MTELIERNKRLSRSLLFKWQRSYFDLEGPDAWRSGTVPHYVTSNPFIARSYAQILFGWLRDLVREDALVSGEPVYVVELGAGSGRLGYQVLLALDRLQGDSTLRDVSVVYVMTDVASSNIDAWREHPQLKSLRDAGRLDFARLDAEDGGAVALLESGRTLRPGDLRNPIAVIANYVFDGLAQDAFVVTGGEIHENLVTLSVPGVARETDDPSLISEVTLTFEQGGLVGSNYYEPDFARILRFYAAMSDGTNVLFPIGALRCLRALRELADDRLLLISADKGYHRLDDVDGRGEPSIAVHGSFSVGVNYHAILGYLQQFGARCLTLDRDHHHLDVCVAILGENVEHYVETRLAHRLAVDELGPDDFYALKDPLVEASTELEIGRLVAYLRLSGWDPKTFQDCLPSILGRGDELGDRERAQLVDAAVRTFDTYFFIGEPDDLAFGLGMLCHQAREFAKAIEFFERSIEWWGRDPATIYNLAVNHAELGEFDVALAYLKEVIVGESAYEPARELLAELE